MLAHSTGPHTLSLAHINVKCFTWNLPLEPLQTKKNQYVLLAALAALYLTSNFLVYNLQLPYKWS